MARKQWTEEENYVLRTCYQTMGSKITKCLPGRSLASCRSQASKLGITYERVDWTKEEVDMLFKYYPHMGDKIVSYLPKRTKSACNRKAKELGIKKYR